ncbi:hypothetical protein K470DRAFT_278091 [Piedraia hortae CBS 480.64]|uniref:DUF7514 domain-containing protein n=1 Tax=Piedraia hortae CBS 480.64 TaxID=1314780 RepID=A0A6A7BUY1_9PEZI|nr:hypothetical protein K470DRAFT_278091 [Piedraia hortae CBS 480.64]
MDQSAANREAYEYWGYLFKADKTGTDKLRFLLQGLKDYINQTFEPSDQPDLLPSQVAAFYRSVHGDYDQLFLHTPPESIAFIYKSLGCLHSLQPLPGAAFSDPTIPALKTEGWIMWQTIQLLLGPEEHAGFLIEAVQSCDIRDHATGELFPKVLSRSCFPSEPDKHMVAWYEGVSERLKREAEEEAQGVHEPERDDRRRPERYQVRGEYDDDGSLTSRGPALAYFRNPLYRHVDGRPSIVRRASKTRAAVKGKEAAMAVGHVFRNIGSPHLWDGNEKDRLRRKSVPDRHHYRDDSYSRQRHLHSSDSEYDLEPLPEHRSVSNNSRPRQSHSYEAMPNRRSGEHPPQPPGRRPSPPSPTSESSDSDVRPGAGFAPSAGPLFATQVAHHPPVRRESVNVMVPVGRCILMMMTIMTLLVAPPLGVECPVPWTVDKVMTMTMIAGAARGPMVQRGMSLPEEESPFALLNHRPSKG